ncbi:squamous cell carcinoma antigen recognized by T-cells 3-like isoform X2 [Hyalella azteca]|uniref:Squamous cell carcinoma antigen recognized by T-cells 3-like isoform X2 n=1 Tax=Hyalella azteca TaxID=294128 RepID=A0A979FIW1_HYAAZ|nr:squamous cell carcinoma antigen recognized by T-cells 3-like isoform X2 [Hyalella azteca]
MSANEMELVAFEETSNMAGSAASDSDDSMSSSDVEEEDEKILEKIKNLRQQLVSWPRFYDGHIELINSLRKSGELLEARQAREAMNKYFPLTPELWLDYIHDEKAVCTTADERNFVISLLDRATKEYASVQVWTEYVLFSIGGGDIDATRDVYERALAAVGTHVRDGELLWQSITCIEEQVYAGLTADAQEGDAPTPQQTRQAQRLRELYRRRFRVPLLNMDREALLEGAGRWGGAPDPHMEAQLQRTLDKLSILEPFEEELLRTEEDAVANMAAYEAYMAHAKAKEDPAFVQNLYERAVLRHPLNDGLWLQYVQWCSAVFRDQTELILPVSERSVRNCPWSGALCSLHVELLQLQHPILTLQPKIKDVVEWCLGALVGVEADALVLHASQMWLSYVLFLAQLLRQQLQRQTQASGRTTCPPDGNICQSNGQNIDHEKLSDTEQDTLHGQDNGPEAGAALNSAAGDEAIGTPEESVDRHMQRLREACRRALQMLRENASPGVDRGDVALCRVWAACEVLVGDLDAARAVWNDLMAQAPYTGRCDLWLQFVEMERRHGSSKHARKLLRRALERVWDGVEVVGAAFEAFEHTEGDVLTLRDFRRRYDARMAVVNKRREEQQAKESAATVATKAGKKNKQRNKHQAPRCQEDASQPAAQPQHAPTNSITSPQRHSSTASPKRQKLGQQTKPGSAPTTNVGHPPAATKRPLSTGEMQEPQPPAKKIRAAQEEEDDRVDEKVAVGKEAFTVFVSNLDFSTRIDDVKDALKDCGTVSHARLVKDFKGRSKGFGFVVFETISGLTKALHKDRTRVRGRPMFVSSYDPDKQGHVFRYATGEEKDKLFVRGLPYSMNEEEVKAAFEAHAPVKEIRLVTHRNGYSKGTCFIRFEDAATAERVRVAMDQTQLRNFTITVLVSNPSAAKQSRQRGPPAGASGPSAGTSGPAAGHASSADGDERKPDPVAAPTTRRPTLVFKPRSITKSKPPAPPPTDAATLNSTNDLSVNSNTTNSNPDDSNPVNAQSANFKSNDDFRKLFSK